MDYLQRSPRVPDNRAIMCRYYNLAAFYGKPREVVEKYCMFDITTTLPVKVECPDETQGLKTLYFMAFFGMSPFVGGKLGAELDIEAIVPASHHAENLVYVMRSHTGYDRRTKTWGRIYREKEGGLALVAANWPAFWNLIAKSTHMLGTILNFSKKTAGSSLIFRIVFSGCTALMMPVLPGCAWRLF